LQNEANFSQFFQLLANLKLATAHSLKKNLRVFRSSIVIAAAAAILLTPRDGQAYEMPWCALTEIGGGAMYENCTLPTFEKCVQEVIAGNRGFCIPNPRSQGPAPEVRQPGGRRKRVDY
jgi:hypothetical protein